MKAKKVLDSLGISRKTLANYIKNGKIRCVPLGNGFYEYNDEDVKFLEKDAIKPNRILIYHKNGKTEFVFKQKQLTDIIELISNFLNNPTKYKNLKK